MAKIAGSLEKLILLYKKDEEANLENYRPIRLLSHMHKYVDNSNNYQQIIKEIR